MSKANYTTYYNFTSELEAAAREEAATKEYNTTGESFAWGFGFVLGTVPHLLNQLQLTEEQAQVVEDYFKNN